MSVTGRRIQRDNRPPDGGRIENAVERTIGTAWLRPTDVSARLAFATPYCQASFSFETFFALICVTRSTGGLRTPPL